MYAHEIDEFGNPTDPVLRELEFHLCDLAGIWRTKWGSPQRQEEIVQEYHATMAKLYSLGWDGWLDMECKLPKRLMPEEYLRRNPGALVDIWRWPIENET